MRTTLTLTLLLIIDMIVVLVIGTGTLPAKVVMKTMPSLVSEASSFGFFIGYLYFTRIFCFPFPFQTSDQITREGVVNCRQAIE